MKKTISLILAFVCLVNMLSIFSVNVYATDDCKILYEIENGEAKVVGFSGKSYNKKIVIDAYYKGVPVTTIGKQAFYCSLFSSIEMPETIKVIEEESFAYCENLQEINIPDSVEIIADYAFGSCEAVTSLTIPENVKEIGDKAFMDCWNTKCVYVLGEIEKIGKLTFAYCDKLRYIQLPETIKQIDNKAFYSTLYLNAIKIPASVTEIGEDAFEHDSKYHTNKKIIYGEKGSFAETYAKNNKYDFYEATDITHKHCCSQGYCIGCGSPFDKSVTTKIKKVNNDPIGIYVLWNKVLDAEGYRVYYKKESENEWHKFCDWKSLTMPYCKIENLESGENYVVGVSVVNGEFEGDIAESEVINYLDCPKMSYKINKDSITISWNKVNGAEKYNICRRKTGEKTFIQLGTVNSKKTSFVDDTAEHGKRYVYAVIAVNDSGESGYEPVGDIVTCLKTPHLVSLKNRKDGVEVTWKRVSLAQGYYIYRKTPSGNWKKVGVSTGNKLSSFVDKTAKNNVKYKYTVRAYNGSGIEEEVLSPFESGIFITYLKAPTISQAKKTSKGITLKWNKIAGADSYRVYRRTEKSDKWSVVANVKGGSVTSCTDKKAKKGVTYRYTVRAIKGDTKGGYDTVGTKVKA